MLSWLGFVFLTQARDNSGNNQENPFAQIAHEQVCIAFPWLATKSGATPGTSAMDSKTKQAEKTSKQHSSSSASVPASGFLLWLPTLATLSEMWTMSF